MPDKEMENKQTAMQELIENFSTMKHVEFIVWLHWAKDELLQKEREQIEESFNQGYRDGEFDGPTIVGSRDISSYPNASDYFTQTYNQ